MPRRRRVAPRTPAVGLDRLLEQIAPEDAAGPGLARIQRVWASVAGPDVAAAARPVALVDGALHLACQDATWAHEIQMLQATVLARIHAAGLVEIQAIRTRSGAAPSR